MALRGKTENDKLVEARQQGVNAVLGSKEITFARDSEADTLK